MTRICIREFLHDEDGGYTILGILWFILFVGIGGLAVDVTDGFRVQTMMQATADAAAHAAVIDLPDEVTAVATALAYAEDNMPKSKYGQMLVAEEVEIGTWIQGTRTFFPGAQPKNAVRVTLRRVAGRGNSVPVNFLRIIGLMEWNIVVGATAVTSGSVVDNCLTNGFVARGEVENIGSNNRFVDNICIHGQEGVKVGSDNYFEDGVSVSMIDDDDLIYSQLNDGLFPGPPGPDGEPDPPGALNEQDFDPPLVDSVEEIVQGVLDGNVVPATFLTLGPVYVGTLPLNPCPAGATDPKACQLKGTLYVVDSKVDFGSDAVVSNIGVVSKYEIQFGSNVDVSNAYFATLGEFKFPSNSVIGHSKYCETGDGEVYVFAQGSVLMGSNNEISGLQIVGAGLVDFNSNHSSVNGIAVQAGGNIKLGSNQVYGGGCAAPTLYLPTAAGAVSIVE